MSESHLRGGRLSRSAPVVLALFIISGCGAKTGLLVPDAEVDEDADLDADVPDDLCVPDRVAVERRRAQVVFVIDRSQSMLWSLSSQFPTPGDPSRWEILRDALGRALAPREHLLEIGAKFYPVEEAGTGIEAACEVAPGIELPPAPGATSALLSVFGTAGPNGGGTPTAMGLAEAAEWLARHGDPSASRHIVLTTDGGPNCRAAPPVPWSSCVCTGPPTYCPNPETGTINCLDGERTLEVVESTYQERAIPVYVIAIDDPTRPDLADFLDLMALAGGRPRAEPSERRFYSVRRVGELDDALETITSTIALCVFVAPVRVVHDPSFELLVDGSVVPQDPGRTDGWDWSDPDSGELTLFGRACARASVPGVAVTGRAGCLEGG